MNIDKSYLKELIMQSRDNAYLLNLYKIYETCNRVTGGKIVKHRKTLDGLEDKIYTIKGKTLSQKERITFELNKVLEKISKIEILKSKYDLDRELIDVIDLFKKCSEDRLTPKLYDALKEKITVLEARMNIPINFLYCGSIAFLNIYESAYINNMTLNNEEELDIYNNFEKIENYNIDKKLLGLNDHLKEDKRWKS